MAGSGGRGQYAADVSCYPPHIQGVPELSEHAFFGEYRHCGAAVEAAVNKLF